MNSSSVCRKHAWYTWVSLNLHTTIHICTYILYIPWIQNLVTPTTGCRISHKNTKHTDLVQYKNIIRVSQSKTWNLITQVLSPFLYTGFTIQVFRWSGKRPMYSQLLQIYLAGKLIWGEQASRILLISSKPNDVFYFS